MNKNVTSEVSVSECSINESENKPKDVLPLLIYFWKSYKSEKLTEEGLERTITLEVKRKLLLIFEKSKTKEGDSNPKDITKSSVCEDNSENEEKQYNYIEKATKSITNGDFLKKINYNLHINIFKIVKLYHSVNYHYFWIFVIKLYTFYRFVRLHALYWEVRADTHRENTIEMPFKLFKRSHRKLIFPKYRFY